MTQIGRSDVGRRPEFGPLGSESVDSCTLDEQTVHPERHSPSASSRVHLGRESHPPAPSPYSMTTLLMSSLGGG
ncbi:MAG: hypothetical protein QOI09_1938 [Chloroflexota bacterium]|nr:hypothetical protein [Chloroflexota bacterium]